MTGIKQLSKAVHSSLRSGVILFDLTRVVEELILNSLDAGATKINIAISVETCYVKVEDDGCGVTRDGLVLLGERYATSKLQGLAEMDASSENFGFRGESLGSLSDISLLEIMTKAQGRPNGYRKIIKGCKCLYLGIDDRRQESGTTVIVRDLFYNQPVRRKYMHSSPKKVLHSVKKCVLRVALVRPQVSFKVTDIESGTDVLCTHPSPTPLPLVSSVFGTDVSRSLCELSYSKGILKLSGFLSALADQFPMKAFQYVYINSRFVSKGPIHKLLNDMASTSKCLDLCNGTSGSPNGKRTQAYPAYILNLCCPRSSYDLMFEPSKMMVEFKDWVPILSFIEQAIGKIWKQAPVQGEFHDQENDISRKDEIWKANDNFVSPIQEAYRDCGIAKKKHKLQHNESFWDLSPLSFSPDIASEGCGLSLHPKKYRRLSGELCKNTKEVKGQPHKHESNCTLLDMSPIPWDMKSFKSVEVSPEHLIHFWSPNNEQLPVAKDILPTELTVRQTSGVDVTSLDSRWGNGFLEVNHKGSRKILLESGYSDSRNEVPYSPRIPKGFQKPFLHSCSLLRSASNVGPVFSNDDGFEVGSNNYRTEELASGDKVNVVVADEDDQHSKFSQKTCFLDNLATSGSSYSILTQRHMIAGPDIVPMNSHLGDGVRFSGDHDLLNNPLNQFCERVSNDLSINSRWSSLSPYPVPRTVAWNAEHFTDKYTSKDDLLLHESANSRNFSVREGKDEFLRYAVMQNSVSQEDCLALNCTNTELNFDYSFSPENNVNDSFHEMQSNDIMIQGVGSSDKLVLETDWLRLDSSVTDNIISYGVPDMHFDSPSYHKDGNSREKQDSPNHGRSHVHKGRSKRSISAPPFYKKKSKFSTIYSYVTYAEGESNSSTSSATLTSDYKRSSQSFGASENYFEQSATKDSLFYSRISLKTPPKTGTMSTFRTSKDVKKSQCHQLYNRSSAEDCTSIELEDLRLSGMKWQNCNPHITERDKSHNLHEQSDILDVSSGLLHLSGGSVVPESINKDCLEDAKVLLQLDKKFIPVVAGVTLAVIDQHAADERIRLEELREKVLSGEGKTVAYLDSEQELVLPEIACQLLQYYSMQIQTWGWICNIHSHGSGSFRKNLNLLHRRTTAVTLIAVPCILGVNLSDKDLLEFLEQLAETDGSSTLPPSVVRVLNFKACRGAIMFGDALLPSESSLIVEELKRTSLCFQCAHGRPTTVPLVNLPALHKQILNLELYNGRSDEPWHGLQRHTPSIERARQRLVSAGGQYG